MSVICSIRQAAIAGLGVLSILWVQAWAAPPPDAAEALEVKVLAAEVQQGEGEGSDVLYRMEVLSVLRSTSGVQPGETVTVRSYGPGQEILESEWIGTAYVNPDPEASGAERRFVIAADSESLVELPPGPPSATITREVPKGGKSVVDENGSASGGL
jgi:hypothetical protein